MNTCLTGGRPFWPAEVVPVPVVVVGDVVGEADAGASVWAAAAAPPPAAAAPPPPPPPAAGSGRRGRHSLSRGRGRRVIHADHDQRSARQRRDAGPADERAYDHAEPEHRHHGRRGGARPGHREPERRRFAVDVRERLRERRARRQIRLGSLLVDRADQRRDLGRQRPSTGPALHAVALVVGQRRVAPGTSERAARLGSPWGPKCSSPVRQCGPRGHGRCEHLEIDAKLSTFGRVR